MFKVAVIAFNNLNAHKKTTLAEKILIIQFHSKLLCSMIILLVKHFLNMRL